MEIKGYTYGFGGKRGMYRSEKGIKSQDALYDLGVNWVCLALVVEQDTCMSTQMHFDFSKTPSDRDLMAAIKHAHDRGVSVCLKPMVNVKDHIWRARISFPDGEDGKDPYWDAWFKNYTDYMVYYAELAQETGCEMLCLGCEMCGTEHKESHWRALIDAVKQVYTGKLMYNTNHGNEFVAQWYDAVDYIGTSAYYSVGMTYPSREPNSDRQQMVENWKYVRGKMQEVHEKWGKPILFAEIGCRSAKTCASMPWDFKHTDLPHDEQEQADFFSSCLEVFSKEEWFAGAFWWDWSTYIYDTREEAAADNGFNIHLKQAEKELKDWYAKL